MKKYPKVYHSQRREVNWEKYEMEEEIVEQEKVDGKNFRIGIGRNLVPQFGSRKQDDDSQSFSIKTYKKIMEHIVHTLATVGVQEVLGALFEELDKICNKKITKMIIFGEYLSKPREQILYYENIPKNHLAVFDIALVSNAEFTMLHPTTVMFQEIVEALGVDTVELLYDGPSRVAMQDVFTWAKKDIQDESFLGGQKREGVVFKNYSWFEQATRFQSLAEETNLHMVKFVREEFAEALSGTRDRDKSKKGNLNEIGFILEYVMTNYITKGRVQKAVMRLEEEHGRGKIDRAYTGSVIGAVFQDILAEENSMIEKMLMKAFTKRMKKHAPLVVQFFQEIQEEELFK